MENCIRHDGDVTGMDYKNRDKKSYIWTFLRDPTDRAMSSVGSRLSREFLKSQNRDSFLSNKSNNDTTTTSNVLVDRALDILKHGFRDGTSSEGRGGFQLEFAMQQIIPAYSVNLPHDPTEIRDPQKFVSQVSA
jgi:hypothetical protein